MQYIDAARTHALLDYPGLVEALRELFRRGVDKLERMGLSQPLPKGESNFWLILPAWQFGRNFGAKLVSVFPGNAAKGKAPAPKAPKGDANKVSARAKRTAAKK